MFIIILAIYTKDTKFVLNTFPRVIRVALKRVISDGCKSCIYSLKTVSACLCNYISSSEASPTFGHANANLSAFIDRLGIHF